MTDEKIIKFPGMMRKDPQPAAEQLPEDKAEVKPLRLPDNLSDDQMKAIACIANNMAFVFVGIRNTDTGADFFTALHGDHTDLRNAEDHLPAIIHRLMVRKGVVS